MKYLILLFVLMTCNPDISEKSDIYTYPKGDPIDSVEVIQPDTLILKKDSLGRFQDLVQGYPLKYFVIHCTFSQAKKEPAPISVFTNYWKNTLGWKRPGYFAIVRVNGDVAFLTTNNFDHYITEDEITNGVKGMNRYSMHIAIEGMAEYRDGKLVNADTRTDAQRKSLDIMVDAVRAAKPDVMVVGHRDIQIHTYKSCPNFDVLAEYGKSDPRELYQDSSHYEILERVKILNYEK